MLASIASALVLVVQAQPGFISIDCGAPNGYTDKNTNIAYEMDDGFISSRKNMHISMMVYQYNLRYSNVRILPDGRMNCYTLRPDQGKNTKYLIRASFWYGNYDGKNRPPSFDLYIDVNYSATMDFAFRCVEEIIYVPKVDDIRVCLGNIGNVVPFISALELRALDDDIYPLGSKYPDDVYDRLWPTMNNPKWSILSNTSAIDLSKNNNAYKVPVEVLRTAQGTMNSSSPLYFRWTTDDAKGIVYLHFTEIERLKSGLQREFTISLNDNQFTETVSLEYLKPVVVVSPPFSGPLITLSINSTNKSGNPPILNAMELYNVVDLPNVPTAQDDVHRYCIVNDQDSGKPTLNILVSIVGLKLFVNSLIYSCFVGISKCDLSITLPSGDPCVPRDYTWDGLNCSYGNPPRIISLKLNSSNLMGDIVSSLSHLSTIEYFLTGNVHLCLAGPYSHKRKQKTILVTVVASVLGFFVALFDSSERTLRSKNRAFEYREVSKITGNFGQVIGKGGFGNVYLGTLNNGTAIVAQLLAILHHGNLVSLFGYCDDSKHKELLYEYMANGNLRLHLSGEHLKVLTWSKRLQIAVDVAQGLDYLHNGCTPPIIHRDLKTSNILFNEDFRAKITDFGLLRAFAFENDSSVSTCPPGTIGYLGLEFQSFGNCDKKSDVYSFGIVLFELIMGELAVMRSRDGNDFMPILEWLIPIVESGDIQRIMDPRLQGEFNTNSAWKVVEIAMSCTQQRAIERPDINHVLVELKESLVSNSSGSFQVTSLEIHCDSVLMAR
ncbi:hypothetical protein BT93_I0335 [Corymbia citriodora subsp. variegata]|nr:hypothetical protein BT93_I0335 [Corymbia citriodora subsp. variegata]